MLLQAYWSYDTMQGLGLALAMEPWLERLHGRRVGAALGRYGGFFNTHPFMAPLTVGMLCGLEEEAAAAPEDKRAALLKRADALKTAVACSLAGVGDALFWGALRPACAAAALVFGFLAARPFGATGFGAMALLYLALYNAPALWLRWNGLELGYRWKDAIAVRLKKFAFQKWIRRLKLAAKILFVVLLALLAAAAPGWPQRALGLAAAAAFALAKRLRPVTTAASFYAAACALGAVLA